jgi:hypothetical protein
MSGGTEGGRLTHGLAAMADLEGQLGALIDRLQGEVAGHAESTLMFERFRATARENRAALRAHLAELGAAPAAAAAAPAEPEASPAPVPGGAYCTGAVSRALRSVSLALNDAAFGYSVLHEAAHVSDSLRYAGTLRLAERNLRRCTAAAQEVNQLIADVVNWELRQAGQFCECRCPACGLGICWCIAHTKDTVNAAWRETAPAYPSSGLPVAPNPRRPEDLDVRDGDVVIAVDGRRVASTADVTSAVVARSPGEPITLGIVRRPDGALEVTARRR